MARAFTAGTSEQAEPADFASCSDDELVFRAARGHIEAFDELVRRYQYKVLQVAWRMVGNPSDAEDIAQEAFLAVYCRLGSYRPQGRFEAYLLRTVVNKSCSWLRWRRRWWAFLRRLHGMNGMNGMVAAGPDGEQRRALAKFWPLLPQKQRAVLALRFGSDMTIDEIADVLGTPAGTVKSRLCLGLRRLRALLEGKSQ